MIRMWTFNVLISVIVQCLNLDVLYVKVLITARVRTDFLIRTMTYYKYIIKLCTIFFISNYSHEEF